jgi:hypothetical protein
MKVALFIKPTINPIMDISFTYISFTSLTKAKEIFIFGMTVG